MLVSGDRNKDGSSDKKEEEVQGFIFSRLQ